MTEGTQKLAAEMFRCLSCGEKSRLVLGSFGGMSSFSVPTGHAFGVIPVGHPCYLQGAVCLACGSVDLRLTDKDLEHPRTKLENNIT